MTAHSRSTSHSAPQRIAALVNPAARSGAHTLVAERAVERLREHGASVVVVSGGSAAESVALLSELADRDDVDALAVIGGDGTAQLALEPAHRSGKPLGIVPAGTGNDLAALLGLRELDPISAADVIAAGHTAPLDVARTTTDAGEVALFATVLASGFDSRVNDRANAMRWPRGHARYNIAILLEFLTLRGLPYTIELVTDAGDARRIDEDLVMATVGNGSTYGGGIPVCPSADPRDGLLDVTLVRPAGRARLLRLLPRLYRGTHVEAAEVETVRVRRIRLESPGVTAYADGDPIGSLPLTIDVLPAAVTLFTPR